MDERKDKKRLKLISEFRKLHKSARDKGLSPETIRAALLDKETPDLNSNLLKTGDSRKYRRKWRVRMTIIIAVFAIFCGGAAVFYDINSLDDLKSFLFYESPCVMSNNGFLIEIARPLTNCSMCQNLRVIPVEENLTTEKFIEKYAYSAVPVLVKNATYNWTAMSTFSFHYFKELYTGLAGALTSVEEECQFFPYKTEFETLAEALNISDARANFSEGEKPWYIGWSNCHRLVAKKLRQHYQRPYFLPSDSESSTLDWIFMGGTGLGAFIHLDYVQRPSWQAQISGRKTWDLIPVPECESVCHSMNVTVEKGDIFVIDSNQWYHATYIHPGEISITIGSEFD